MRKEIAAPAVALLGGVLGFVLRLLGLRTGFEPLTGLAIHGSAINMALIGFSVLTAVVLFFQVRPFRGPSPLDFDLAYSAPGNTLYVTAIVLAAFLMFGSAVLSLREDRSLMRLLLSLLTALSGFCLLYLAKGALRGERRRGSLALLIPGYTGCLWFLNTYRGLAGDPVLLSYFYQLLAVICVLLGLYYTATFAFARPKPARTAFFCLLGAYFSIVSLADRPSPAYTLLYAAFALFALAYTAILLGNLSHPESAGITKETDREELSDES